MHRVGSVFPALHLHTAAGRRLYCHCVGENKSEAKAQRAMAKEAKKAQMEMKRQQKNDTEHVYFHCPKCNQEMRAPKGKGKILVTCKNCGEKFEKTT